MNVNINERKLGIDINKTYGLPTVNPQNRMNIKINRSFTMSKDFLESKRFKRYVKKTMDYIYTCICNSQLMEFTDVILSTSILSQVHLDEYKSVKATDYNTAIIRILQAIDISTISLFDTTWDKGFDISTYIQLYHPFSYCEVYDIVFEKMWYQIYYRNSIFSGPINGYEDDFNSLEYIIYKETVKQCIQYLETSMKEMDITESNFMQFVPDNGRIATNMFYTILNNVYLNVELLFKDCSLQEAYQISLDSLENKEDKAITDEKIRNAKKRQDELNNLAIQLDQTKSEYEKKISELEAEISKLKNEVESKNLTIKNNDDMVKAKIAEVSKGINDENRQLKRENQKLTDKYNDLYDKYSNLKSSSTVSISDDCDEPEKVSAKHLDKNAKYLFVILARTSFATFRSNVLEEFPNAQFCDKCMSISNKNIDAVIFITSFIKHNIYHNIKEQCVANNIPFVHCDNTNIAIIKEAMQETFQF